MSYRGQASDQRGFVLLTSLVFATFFLVWAAVGFQRSATELNASQRYVQTLQAFQATEAGLEEGHRYLRSLGVPPAGTAAFDPFGGAQAVNAGQFTVTIDPDDTNPTSFLDLFTISSTGQVTGTQVTRRLSKMLSTESFARYSYFTNSERMSDGTRIWFTSRDRLTGPVHTNDRLSISGSPVFNGPVSSAAASINYRSPPPTGGNNPQFNQGLTFNAPTVQLPTNVTALRVAAADAQGLWLTGNSTITLQSDGTMLVTNATRGWHNALRPLPANGAVFVNGGNVTVSGTLNGQLTIGSNRDIIIANDVRYASDPRSDPQSDDVLGLTAEQNVVLARTTPSNLTLQASIMALHSSFTVERWWEGPPKGTLTVYGGLIQRSRGPVGTFNGSTGAQLSGYVKDYWYDTRFSNLAPPFFPTTGTYREVLWRQH